MISRISFSGIVKPQADNRKPVCFSAQMPCDTFEKTENSLSKTISYAKDKITAVLKQNNID